MKQLSKRKILVFITIIATLFTFLFYSKPGLAQTNTTATPTATVSPTLSVASGIQAGAANGECDSFQIILMVDLSWSMDSTDPLRLRYSSASHLANILANNYLAARDSSMNDPLKYPVTIKYAVIHFASTAEVAQNWMTIAPSSLANWDDQSVRLKPTLELDNNAYADFVSVNGNGTNMVNAFMKAEELALLAETPVDGCPERILLLLTDGNPTSGRDPLKGRELDGHMEQVQEITERSFSGPGDYIFVTGINDPEADYWLDTQNWWKKITHDGESSEDALLPRAERVDTQAAIGARLSAIAHNRLGDFITPIMPGTLVVPPYLESLRLTFYKSDLSDVMTLSNGNGEMAGLQPNVIISGENDAIQTIEVVRPEPGIYQLATNAKSEEYLITKQEIFVQSYLASASQEFQQFTTGNFEIQLADNKGDPLPDYGEDYILYPSASIVSSADQYDLNLVHDSANSMLQGNFTPMDSGEHSLLLGAYAIDDQNNRHDVLKKEETQFDFKVDPISVKIGDAASDRDQCPISQYTQFSIPLQIVNYTKDESTAINLPITWSVESTDFTSVGIFMEKENSQYTLTAIPVNGGELELALIGNVTDPLDGSQHEFYKTTLNFPVATGKEYILNVVGYDAYPSKISLWFENLISRVLSVPKSDYLVDGRHYFFWNQDVVIQADYSERSNTAEPLSTELLPEIELVSVDDGESFEGKGWRKNQDGIFENVFSAPGVGVYQLKLLPKELPCDVEIDLPTDTTVIRLIPNFGEWLIKLLFVLLILTIIGLAIRAVLCRVLNPLKGFLAMYSQADKRVWYQSLAGKSCHYFKMDNPAQKCYVYSIKVIGWNQRNGKFKLLVTSIDPSSGKKVRRQYFSSVGNVSPISIGGGSKIIWRATQTELP